MSPEFYSNNRRRLMEAAEADVAVLAAHDAMQLAADQSVFKQNADFLYVTGINEVGWQLIVEKNPYSETLVAPDRDEMQVLFEGGLTRAQATAISGVAKIVAATDGAVLLESLASKVNTAGVIGRDPHEKYNHSVSNPSRARTERSVKRLFQETIDLRPALARLRAIKQPEEVAMMRRAIDATIIGFKAVNELIQNGAGHEYELEAVLSHAFRSKGTHGHAYEPIVAYNKNACVLHYSKNESALGGSGLVLIDAGASFHGYAADITRTFSVGEITERQKAVHAAVEEAHKKIIAAIRPGFGLKEYNELVDDTMKQALQSLELLKDDADYRKYFPHAIGHGLGLDVHESLGGYAEFMPGMVLTVEPGIYIPEEGIGVRIEDDILVTESGNEVLSAQLPTSLCYNL